MMNSVQGTPMSPFATQPKFEASGTRLPQEIIAPLDHAEACVESTLTQMRRLDLLLTPQMNSVQGTPMSAFATQPKFEESGTRLPWRLLHLWTMLKDVLSQL